MQPTLDILPVKVELDGPRLGLGGGVVSGVLCVEVDHDDGWRVVVLRVAPVVLEVGLGRVEVGLGLVQVDRPPRALVAGSARRGPARGGCFPPVGLEGLGDLLGGLNRRFSWCFVVVGQGECKKAILARGQNYGKWTQKHKYRWDCSRPRKVLATIHYTNYSAMVPMASY